MPSSLTTTFMAAAFVAVGCGWEAVAAIIAAIAVFLEAVFVAAAASDA